MKLFGKTFGKKKDEPNFQTQAINNVEHAVIVSFNYGIQSLKPLHELESNLENVILENKVGEYDGNDFAVDYSDGTLYMYGPNAETLFKAIKTTLESCSFMNGAIVKLRFGPPEAGVKEIDIEL